MPEAHSQKFNQGQEENFIASPEDSHLAHLCHILYAVQEALAQRHLEFAKVVSVTPLIRVP